MNTDLDGSRRPLLLPLLGVGLLYAVATVAFTWPLAQNLDTLAVAGPKDGPMFLWNHWWGGHAAFELGTNPLRTEHLFAPEGTSLSLHTHALFPSLLTYPVRAAFGTLVAFNVSLLLSVWLSALGAYLLADEILRDRRAAFVAGMAFAFCHLRASTMMFHNLAQTHLLVLFCWAAWATMTRRSWTFGILGGLFGAALLYSSYTLAVLAGVWAAAFVLYALLSRLREGPAELGRLSLRALAPVAVLAALAAPLALELQAELEEHGDYTSMRRLDHDPDEGLVELRAITELEISPLHRYIVRAPMEAGRQEDRLQLRRACYLGWVVLACSLLGVVFHARRLASWWWLALALFFTLASMGESLDLEGLVEDPSEGEAMRLPYAWLRDVPLLDSLRVPHRYGLLASMAFAVLAGFGWKAILRFVSSRLTALLLTLLAAAGVFFDYAQLPFPKLWEVPQPQPVLAEALQSIRDDPRDCCVLNYPGGRKGYSMFSYYDTFHEKPVYLEGQIARRIPALEERQDQSDLRQALSSPYYGTLLNAAELKRLQRKLRREVNEQRVGWIVLAFEGSTRYESPPHNLQVPDVLDRCKALTRLIRGAFPIDPDWPPTLTTSRWTSRDEDILRRPDRQIEAYEESGRVDRRGMNAIFLVAKLRIED